MDDAEYRGRLNAIEDKLSDLYKQRRQLTAEYAADHRAVLPPATRRTEKQVLDRPVPQVLRADTRAAMRWPRWAHRAYARAFGYFWIPCPRCGVEFGGHEWEWENEFPCSIPTDIPTVRKGVCNACCAELSDIW